ncbi:DUF4142 domain-containing protein [Nonomuraea phyllanthi]|uniref:DUF4142 domain-containing protein n=1 Tax=Nonomuraea phyllanthi TaxID=2219224 RepID=A0A5C4WX79_9ACTN|nr:DUF4142 domain-containing protein [Nonomuraea phyllanthi]KAB8197406.1 DUF4142 domain-containing protein [Nonomuraea phyllanthi]
MRLHRSRRVLVACGIAALCPLTACAGYTPTPSTDTVAVGSLPTADTVPTDTVPVDATPSDSASAQADPDGGTWETEWGPLSEADRELMRKVRLATLWEMIISQEAAQRASTARVRQISKEISAQHHTLDEQVRELAGKLDVQLPVKATAQQQGWMADISGRKGSSYDATYVKWLRLAHGQIFGLIGAVRGSTQNTLIRRFSEQANAAVLNHQRLLESTGLTTPESFPDPPE